MPAHGLSRTGCHTHITTDAKGFIYHDHTLGINLDGKGGTDSYASLALVADVDIVTFCRFSNPDAGFLRIIHFEIDLRTGAFADPTGDALFGKGLQILFHQTAPDIFL
jgi:hypothetical protein